MYDGDHGCGVNDDDTNYLAKELWTNMTSKSNSMFGVKDYIDWRMDKGGRMDEWEDGWSFYPSSYMFG